LSLTKAATRRLFFTLSCLTRTKHGSDLVARHSDELTTCLFMSKAFQLRQKKHRPRRTANHLTRNHLST
jgi:hypothetical protein